MHWRHGRENFVEPFERLVVCHDRAVIGSRDPVVAVTLDEHRVHAAIVPNPPSELSSLGTRLTR